MTVVATTDSYPQFDVPREDGSTLVEPAVADLKEMLRKRAFDGAGCELEFCGKPLEVVRQHAREEVVRKAIEFTRRYRDVQTLDSRQAASTPIVLSGHQPELFHAGVWFKNFLLSELAAQSGGVAINFLVDNDLCRSASIRVPSRDASGALVAQSVLFDSPRDAVPWELRRLDSRQVWEDFPAAVQRSLLPIQGEPLLAQMWPDAMEAVRRSDRIGLAIAEARHKLEQRIGLETLEVPLSQLVSTRAFARFSIQLLSQLPRFQEVYNSQLDRYRQIHRIRSHAHPVPALEQEHGWLEAPWWIYRVEAPKRQRMWVRVVDEQLIVSDRAGWQAVIEGRLDCDSASSQWLDLLGDGICLRPRALLTTMYLRMMVSDLFIHGIGGGKYDQLTDAIVREFFGIEPPPMAVATSTLHLPLAAAEVAEVAGAGQIQAERSAQRQKLWQLRHHADQFVAEPTHEAQQLAAKKQLLLENIPPRGEKWQWHREMTAINRRLSELVTEQAEASKSQLEQLAVMERRERVVQSREYSFCLYPLEFISEQLTRMAQS